MSIVWNGSPYDHCINCMFENGPVWHTSLGNNGFTGRNLTQTFTAPNGATDTITLPLNLVSVHATNPSPTIYGDHTMLGGGPGPGIESGSGGVYDGNLSDSSIYNRYADFNWLKHYHSYVTAGYFGTGHNNGTTGTAGNTNRFSWCAYDSNATGPGAPYVVGSDGVQNSWNSNTVEGSGIHTTQIEMISVGEYADNYVAPPPDGGGGGGN